jgi:hypothetical protein
MLKQTVYICALMANSDPNDIRWKAVEKLLLIHPWLYSPLLGPGLFFSFVIFLYTDGRTPWTSDQPVASQLPIQRKTHKQKKCIQRHPCLELDSNPGSERSSAGRQLMPQPARHGDRRWKGNLGIISVSRVTDIRHPCTRLAQIW